MQQLLNGYEEVSDLEMMMTEGGYTGTGGGYVPDSYVQQYALNYTPTAGSQATPSYITGITYGMGVDAVVEGLKKMGVSASVFPPSLSTADGSITVNGSGVTIKIDNGPTLNFTINPIAGTAGFTATWRF